MASLDVPVLDGSATGTRRAASFRIVEAEARELAAYRRLRREVFVEEQRVFGFDDADRVDDDPRTVVLVALADDGSLLGGVRLAPATSGRDLGWWNGSRLVVARQVRGTSGLGRSLVEAACGRAVAEGVLRFEATVQPRNEPLFLSIGWVRVGEADVEGMPHVRMRWPIDRIQHLADQTKRWLAELLEPSSAWSDSAPESLGGAGFVGDDGAPVPGSDLIAACDAILPTLIERDPEWAGWCAVLVNVNDLAAMGAAPVGLMNAVGHRTASAARRVMNGLRAGAQAWGVPVLGGHTQLGVSPALSVTALGRAATPVRGGGGRFGDTVSVTADITGGWRRGFGHAQWDSTSARSGEELRHLTGLVARAFPHAAKDVSMAGLVGTTGMLAEASGYGAVLDVDRIPAPADARLGDWLTCFPGFGMVTADQRGSARIQSPLAVSAEVGELTAERGVRLRWPDGTTTAAIRGAVTGMGRA